MLGKLLKEYWTYLAAIAIVGCLIWYIDDKGFERGLNQGKVDLLNAQALAEKEKDVKQDKSDQWDDFLAKANDQSHKDEAEQKKETDNELEKHPALNDCVFPDSLVQSFNKRHSGAKARSESSVKP